MISFQYVYYIADKVIEVYEITSIGWYCYSRNEHNTVKITQHDTEGRYQPKDIFYVSEPSIIEFKDGILESVKPRKENSCKHEWVLYTGLNYSDEYCKVCGNKK